MSKKKKAPKKGKAKSNTICENRRARRNYSLGETYEAGLVLVGSEVKACRQGKAHLNEAFIHEIKGELFLAQAHIAEYSHGGPYFNHRPERGRKLLLHAREIAKIARKLNEKGFTAVPLALYFKNGFVKVKFALGKGQTHEDRRQVVKERETNRELRRVLRRGNR